MQGAVLHSAWHRLDDIVVTSCFLLLISNSVFASVRVLPEWGFIRGRAVGAAQLVDRGDEFGLPASAHSWQGQQQAWLTACGLGPQEGALFWCSLGLLLLITPAS